MAGDSNYPNVKILLNGNEGPLITDSSSYKKIITNVGATISTTQSKFGGSSIYFNGSSYLTLDGDFAFGTRDFTVEFFIWASSYPATIIFDGRNAENGFYPYIDVVSSKVNYFVNSAYKISGTTTLSASTWYHVALCRSGSSTKLFLNGTQEGSTWTDSTAMLMGSNRPSIGSNGFTLGQYMFPGYIDNLRITDGVARYTSNFTPPSTEFLLAGQLSGNITESLAVYKWLSVATDAATGAFVGAQIGADAATTYSIPCNAIAPCNIQLSAYFKYPWSGSKAAVLDELVIPSNPQTTPHLFKVTTAGTFDATTEATWNLSGTTTQGSAVLTYVGPFPDRPLALGPKIPS